MHKHSVQQYIDVLLKTIEIEGVTHRFLWKMIVDKAVEHVGTTNLAALDNAGRDLFKCGNPYYI
eukprot:COSAG01_NODE_35730_length_527_cov_1.329439_1_plen_64_part_00